jgi:hypothetical protein
MSRVQSQPLGNPIAPARLPMSTDRMRGCLYIIGWPQREAARQLLVNESAIRQMARGKSAIPDTFGVWRKTLAAFHGHNARQKLENAVLDRFVRVY